MHCKKQQVLWLLAAVAFAPFIGCTGGVLPSQPTEPRIDSLFSLLRPAEDAAEVSDPQTECLLPGEPSTRLLERLFDDLNEYRQAHGLSTLVYSLQLEAVANAHLQDMYERGYFDHFTPEGLDPGDRAMEGGFCHKYVGENLAAGQRSVPAVMRAWDQSPSHQQNMLEPNYVYVGVGHFVDPLTGRQYWAQEFAYHVQ